VEPSSRAVAVAWTVAGFMVAVFAFLSAMVWHSVGSMAWERPFMDRAFYHPPPAAEFWHRLFEPRPFLLITFAIAAIALFDRRPKLALSGTVGCLIAAGSAKYFFKPVIERRQPYHPSRWFPDRHEGYLTFPSGHVAAAAACATFAWFVLNRRTRFAALAFVVPLIVAWAMLALELHYPGDLAAGFVLGVLGVCATVLGAERAFGRDDVTRGARREVPNPPGSS
jgi:membrane-associated phospholipid phosphatase